MIKNDFKEEDSVPLPPQPRPDQEEVMKSLTKALEEQAALMHAFDKTLRKLKDLMDK